MKEIKLTHYQSNDLIRILEYAKKHKKEEFNNKKLTKIQYDMDKKSIENILETIKTGRYNKDSEFIF